MLNRRYKPNAKFSDLDISALEGAIFRTYKPEEIKIKRCEEEGEKELKLNVSSDEAIDDEPAVNLSQVLSRFSQVIDVPLEIVRDDDDEMEVAMIPDDRYIPILASLASVGIVSDVYSVKPEFYPHGREIYLMPNLGEFSYRGETIEDFFFPTVGAEKFGKGTFQSIGVATREGVISNGVYTDIIDSAREKKDGEEVIVYKIRTKSYECSFKWSSCEHVALTCVADPGHYELVGDILFFLSGTNSLNGRRHEWEYLSEALINVVKEGEGLIVRMSGKEYRLPWQHSATFSVVNKCASDLSGSLSFSCDLEDGLYDFLYSAADNSWIGGKFRRDKNRPDHITGINDMITRTATLKEFLKGVAIGKNRYNSPGLVSVVPLSQDLAGRVQQAKDVTTIKVRVTGNYKHPDSFRRILVKDLEDKGKLDSMSIVPIRPNIIVSSGRVIMFKRHQESIAFKIKGKYYVTNLDYGRGRVKYIRLRTIAPYSLNIHGNVLRVYELDCESSVIAFNLSDFRNNLPREDCSLVPVDEETYGKGKARNDICQWQYENGEYSPRGPMVVKIFPRTPEVFRVRNPVQVLMQENEKKLSLSSSTHITVTDSIRNSSKKFKTSKPVYRKKD